MIEKDEVIATVPAGDDVQLHFKVTRVDGVDFVQVRQFVVSTKVYGRGVVVAARDYPGFLAAARAVSERLKPPPRRVGGKRV